jgi:hypothetical protein
VTVPNRQRTTPRYLAQARPPARPASQGETLAKLIGVSLFAGLLLVSLDITPRNVWSALQDVEPLLEQLGRSLWRFGDILLGCLVAGGAIVLPLWFLHRMRKAKRAKEATKAPASAT